MVMNETEIASLYHVNPIMAPIPANTHITDAEVMPTMAPPRANITPAPRNPIPVYAEAVNTPNLRDN